MSSELLDWVYTYLEQDEEIVVPIKKMWNQWRAARPGPSLEVFTAMVLADGRFEEMGGVDHAEGFEDWSPQELADYEREMEQMGYFSGPRAKLKSREITREHIARMITKHNDRLETALRQARAALPDDGSEQEEGQLIDAIVMVEQLRQELREAGLEADEEPEP